MSDRPPLRLLHGEGWPPSFLAEVGRKLSDSAGTVTSAGRYSPDEVLDALAQLVAAAVAAELEVSRYTERDRPTPER